MSDSDTMDSDRPLPTEIEVTPEMIEAGLMFLPADYDNAETALIRMFRAMVTAAPKRPVPSLP